jgi:hypothetical protein
VALAVAVLAVAMVVHFYLKVITVELMQVVVVLVVVVLAQLAEHLQQQLALQVELEQQTL